ncbi:MAG: Abi family protein [Erysipelotrichaceae bacterium]|nr:Abi family protein [Erysipelotrichaceae bacterium]
MKVYKTFNQQLSILRSRGLIVPTDGKPKRFLEQENYYNVINGYKDLFLKKNKDNTPLVPEVYLDGTHFNELKALFLFDRELRILFLKYILIFENSFKTVIAHEFSRAYQKENSYLEIQNYVNDNPKKVLQQISILTKTIHDNVDKNGAIKHYIEEHGSVPLWVLVNYLTIGNLSHLYDILKDGDKNSIAKYYSHKYKNQYHTSRDLKIQSSGLKSALKIINLVRNKCAHDERLYNSDFGHVGLSGVSDYYGMNKINNKKIVVVIIWLKVLLDKKYFQIFYSELEKIFKKYQEDFKTVKFDSILKIMGINIKEIQKLK